MTDAIQKAREARFHIDRMNAWLRELWEAKSLTLHMSDGTTRSDMFGLLQNIRSDVMAIRDSALAALDAETEVKVRELEWEEVTAARSDADPHREHTGDYEAVSPIGVYYIEQYFGSDSYGWRVTLHGSDDVADKDDPEDAKAAAQADYERRIRSALVPPESRS